MNPRVTTALILAMLLVSAVERPASGATPQKAIVPTFTVDDPADNVDLNPGDGACVVAFTFKCSLRAAIQEANALAGGQVIVLPPGTYTLTRTGADEDLSATGDLDLLDDVTILGAGWGQTIISAGFIDRVFDVHNGVVADVESLQVRYGDVTSGGGGGGGIRVILGGEIGLTDVSIYGNLADEGAGLSNHGTASLTSSEVAYNYTVGASPNGGGLFNQGSLSVIRSSIHDNGATAVGGGIYTDGRYTNQPTPTTNVVGSTITANTPDGIYSLDTDLTVSGSTIAENGANGVTHWVLFNGSLTLSCSIVSGHSDKDCILDGTSSGYNLSQDGTCSGLPSDRTGDPKLGLLSTGSFPPGRAPLVGSPAIDGGSNAICPSPDQWGRSRPLDLDRNGTAISNIGALEDVMIFGDGFESGDLTAW